MTTLRTVQSADAHGAATRDRTGTADAVLTIAINDATRRLHRGLPLDYVAARLETACRRADRILGTHTDQDPS